MDLTRIKSYMDFVDLIWHLTGFAMPALAVATGVVLVARFFERNRPPVQVLIRQVAINFFVCLAVLVLGLVLTGHDGRMLTYGALVLASATLESLRGARRRG